MRRTDAYDQLKELMLTGELRAGQFVSQRELTALLGATLNPVREAIRKLEAEGLINVYAQRGIQIIEAGPKAINDAFDYRALLELSAIRAFADGASQKDLDAFAQRVEAALGALTRCPDDPEVAIRCLDEDYMFHKDLIDFQGNEIISRHYALNAARLRLFRLNMGQPYQRLATAAREHLDILDACRRRDADLAALRLARHIEISREHSLGLRPMRYAASDAAAVRP